MSRLAGEVESGGPPDGLFAPEAAPLRRPPLAFFPPCLPHHPARVAHPVPLPPENISRVDNVAAPRGVAELAARPWNRRMVRFLVTKRRRGKPIRWIAQRLGLDLMRVVAMAVNLRLTLPTAYDGRRCHEPAPEEPPPLGPENDIAAPGLCRWIAADPSGPYAMCARPAEEGWPYCTAHKARAYKPRRQRLRSNVSLYNCSVMARLDPGRATAKRDAAALGGRLKGGHDVVNE